MAGKTIKEDPPATSLRNAFSKEPVIKFSDKEEESLERIFCHVALFKRINLNLKNKVKKSIRILKSIAQSRRFGERSYSIPAKLFAIRKDECLNRSIVKKLVKKESSENITRDSCEDSN